jgi:hypothetical protein
LGVWLGVVLWTWFDLRGVASRIHPEAGEGKRWRALQLIFVGRAA